MKKIILLSAILAGLAGCSSSDDAPTAVSGTVTAAELVGTWLIACEAEAGGSFNVAATLTATTGEIAVSTFDDAICTPITQNGMETDTFSYTLGADFALDGTVASITTGTELDSIDTNTLVSSFDSIALVGTSLYLGDDEADPAKDASSPAARPTTLDDTPLIKQ